MNTDYYENILKEFERLNTTNPDLGNTGDCQSLHNTGLWTVVTTTAGPNRRERKSPPGEDCQSAQPNHFNGDLTDGSKPKSQETFTIRSRSYYTDSKDLIISVDLPGVIRSSINVNTTKSTGILDISATRNCSSSFNIKHHTAKSKIPQQKLTSSFFVSPEFNLDDLCMTLNNGVLFIEIPKAISPSTDKKVHKF